MNELTTEKHVFNEFFMKKIHRFVQFCIPYPLMENYLFIFSSAVTLFSSCPLSNKPHNTAQLFSI